MQDYGPNRPKGSWLSSFFAFSKSSAELIRSEARVTIFVWAIVVSYVAASGLRPNFRVLALIIPASYFLVLAGYILSDLTDMDDDRINSPKRPLVSGRAKVSHAEVLFVISLSIALTLSLFINVATLGVFVVLVILGLSYAIPRVNIKNRFPMKAVVPAAGAAIIALGGGAAAQGFKPIIFFVAIAFSLFALVTLLLGDIADVTGDAKSGVRSIPLVIGTKNSARFIMSIPIIISALGVFLFRLLDLNLAFPIMLIAVSAYCFLAMRPLLTRYDDASVCRNVKSRMRIAHFLILLTFVLGLIVI